MLHVKKFLPWQMRGRWYELFIESDGIDYTVTKNPISGAALVNGIIKLPEGYHIIDVKMNLHSFGAPCQQMPNLVQCYVDGTQGIVLPQVNCFDYVKIYLYVEVY